MQCDYYPNTELVAEQSGTSVVIVDSFVRQNIVLFFVLMVRNSVTDDYEVTLKLVRNQT